MSNPESTETASDQRVSASVCVVGVLTEALAQHHPVGFGKCHCGWFTVTELGLSWREKHEAHVASVVAALPNIAIDLVPNGLDCEPNHELREYLENLFSDVRNNRDESVEEAADHLKRYFL